MLGVKLPDIYSKAFSRHGVVEHASCKLDSDKKLLLGVENRNHVWRTGTMCGGISPG